MSCDEKQRTLSTKSLGIVGDWCERNDDDPLTKAYMGACDAVASLDCSAIYERLEKSLKVSTDQIIREAYKPYYLSFQYRDTIGRMIFDLNKREQT